MTTEETLKAYEELKAESPQEPSLLERAKQRVNRITKMIGDVRRKICSTLMFWKRLGRDTKKMERPTPSFRQKMPVKEPVEKAKEPPAEVLKEAEDGTEKKSDPDKTPETKRILDSRSVVNGILKLNQAMFETRLRQANEYRKRELKRLMPNLKERELEALFKKKYELKLNSEANRTAQLTADMAAENDAKSLADHPHQLFDKRTQKWTEPADRMATEKLGVDPDSRSNPVYKENILVGGTVMDLIRSTHGHREAYLSNTTDVGYGVSQQTDGSFILVEHYVAKSKRPDDLMRLETSDVANNEFEEYVTKGEERFWAGQMRVLEQDGQIPASDKGTPEWKLIEKFGPEAIVRFYHFRSLMRGLPGVSVRLVYADSTQEPSKKTQYPKYHVQIGELTVLADNGRPREFALLPDSLLLQDLSTAEPTYSRFSDFADLLQTLPVEERTVATATEPADAKKAGQSALKDTVLAADGSPKTSGAAENIHAKVIPFPSGPGKDARAVS